jgi:YVTN family beta-propeller protein
VTRMPSRRAFLALLAATPGVVVAACSDDDSEAPSSGPPTGGSSSPAPRVVPRLTPSFTTELSQDVVGYEPIFQTLLSGTFVPQGATVDVDAQVLGYAAGNALVNVILVYGAVEPVGSTRALRSRGTYSPPADGVRVEKLGGSESEERLRVSRRVRLEGLTAGATYTWAMQFSIVGSSESIPLPRRAKGPARVCVLRDDSKSYVSCFESGHVVIVRNGGRPLRDEPDETRTHEVAATVRVGRGPLFLTPTSDGSRVLVVNVESRTVSVLDAKTDRVVARSRRLPSEPNGVACRSETAYVATADGRIHALDLGANEWAEPITVSSHLSGDLHTTTDGSHLLAMSAVDQRAYKIRLPDGAVVASSPRLDGAPQCSTVAPDDALWIGTFGSPGALVKLGPDTLDPVAGFAGPGGGVTGVDVTDDGKILWVTTDTGYAAYWTIDSPDDPIDNRYDAPNLGGANGGVALTSDGYIYLCRHGANELFHFPGAVLYVRPTGGDLGELAVNEFADVTFDGALEGSTS